MRAPRRAAALTVLAGALAPAAATAADAAEPAPGAHANPATAQELPQVTVIANAPLAGLGLPLSDIPANVQTADSEDMRRQETLNLADYLNNNFSGISASASADNPFQMDVNYHGYTASPLIGTPEGLSVYVDGVRVNESFGDTVNWDLIPEGAISTVTLMSGSNPVFGLNTLGGALLVRTKSGHDNPGSELEASGGSFGRRQFSLESGGELGAFDYFVTGNYFDEDGWRDLSPSRLWQGFGKVGWQNERSDVDLSYSYADTRLYGNGAVPESMLAYRRASSYTPDLTENLLHFVNLSGTQFLTPQLLLSGNVFYRRLVTSSVNGNVSDNYLSPDYSGPALDCAAAPGSLTGLVYCSAGQKAAGRVAQRMAGFGLQLTSSQDVLGRTNQAIAGFEFSRASDSFVQTSQFGTFAADRTLQITPSPFNDETVISLGGENNIYGAYLTDTFTVNPLLHLALSIRYNHNTETLDGYSLDSALGPRFNGVAQLSGNHSFSRVNPALGFTLTPRETLTLYANYNEASRAPTVIELGCANAIAPCGLPNDFASDPPLKQVVARTVELGARGSAPGGRLSWSADVFHAVNSDDIQFVGTNTNSGYFSNFGTTRRQGLDAAVGGRLGRLAWHLTYSFVDATFQTPFAISANSNSTADANGNILVRAGDRLPLIPRHTGRLSLAYQLNERVSCGASLIGISGIYLHGNENNANQAGATNAGGNLILGSGSISGYTVVNLQGTYHLAKQLELFAHLVNALDRRYATAGFLTTNAFTPSGRLQPDPNTWTNENAVSPAAPRALWAGLRLTLK